jgi:hypothetical protein
VLMFDCCAAHKWPVLRAPPGQVVDALQQQQFPDGPLLHSGDFWINPNPPHVWPQLHSNLPPPPNPAASYGWPGQWPLMVYPALPPPAKPPPLTVCRGFRPAVDVPFFANISLLSVLDIKHVVFNSDGSAHKKPQVVMENLSPPSGPRICDKKILAPLLNQPTNKGLWCPMWAP